MIPKRYDLAFGIGSSCNCAGVLRKAGLQYLSLPLDWMGRVVPDQPISEAFRQRVDLTLDDFKGLLLLENLVYASREGNHVHSEVNDLGTGIAFFHDFPCAKTLTEAHPEVVAKYRRRIGRFKELLRASRSVLIVWMGDARDNGRLEDADIAYCLKRFSAAYPQARFNMLLLESPEGFPRNEHRLEQGDSYDRHLLNFRCEGAEADVVWRIDEDRALLALTDYSVRDYRSRQELKTYRRACRKKELALFHARNGWELLWCKFQYRLYKHLRKRLERRGVKVEST